jgi:hypothetical protein
MFYYDAFESLGIIAIETYLYLDFLSGDKIILIADLKISVEASPSRMMIFAAGIRLISLLTETDNISYAGLISVSFTRMVNEATSCRDGLGIIRFSIMLHFYQMAGNIYRLRA